jgi:hypothetical protein
MEGWFEEESLKYKSILRTCQPDRIQYPNNQYRIQHIPGVIIEQLKHNSIAQSAIGYYTQAVYQNQNNVNEGRPSKFQAIESEVTVSLSWRLG